MYVGSKTKGNEYSLRRMPRTAGPTSPPPNPDPNPIPTHSRSTVVPALEDPGMFICPNCSRPFKTKIGLGVHRRSAHPAIVNEEIDVHRDKRRWGAEELRLMAREEACAVKRGVRFINQHLVSVVPGRTLEAIKGARRGQAYRALVAAATDDITASSDSSTTRSSLLSTPTTPSTPGTSPSGTPQRAEPTSPRISSPNVSFLGQMCDDIHSAIRGLIPVVRNIRGWESEILTQLASDSLYGIDVSERMSSWFSSVFPPPAERPLRPHRRTDNVRLGRKARRRREYARVQRLFRSNMSWAAREILDNTGDQGATVPDVKLMADHWGPYISRDSRPLRPAHRPRRKPELAHLWFPISCEEVATTNLPLRSAPGLDGVSVRQWRAVPPSLRALFFNIVLATGGFPTSMLTSRTIFVRKKTECNSPADFRPISITSVTVRQLHKILATRLRTSGIIDPRQRCFEDGCGENITALASSIHESRSSLRELHVALLDVAKAYDSVSHHSISRMLDDLGVPQEFAQYIQRLYANSSTVFEVRGERSELYRIGRGVRQGDPFSSMLFCLVVDNIMNALPPDVGFQLDESRLDTLAYADDVLLFAGSVWGLQKALRAVEDKAREHGLNFNAQKCSVLSLVPSGKVKKIKVVTTPTFQLGEGTFIPQITTTDEWRYLGIDFCPTGPKKVKTDLAIFLDRITKAPLKPQQRLILVRCFLLPRIYHALVLGRATLGKLRALDLQIRAAVRRWLRLPKDTPTGFMHASVRGGGLGIPALSTTIPGLMRQRLLSLKLSRAPQIRAIAESSWVERRLRWATNALTRDTGILSSKYLRDSWWTRRLHNSADGFELRESHKSPLSTRWMDADSLNIPGRDFVQYVHVRINALPTLIRTSRGARRNERATGCRAGCLSTETAAHVIQGCFRTHGGRVLRHNAVSNTLAAGLKNINWTVHKEPVFTTSEGRRKPDLVCVKDERVSVVDVQVVSGVPPLDESHERKSQYYGNNTSLVEALAARYRVRKDNISFSSCTLSWRGVWSARSADWLLGMGLTSKLLRGITTRVLQGSHTNWTRWNQMTSYGPPVPQRNRQGIG